MKEKKKYFARNPQGGRVCEQSVLSEDDRQRLNEGIIDTSRPALTIIDNKIETSNEEDIENGLSPHRERIEIEAMSVGRIYIGNEPSITLGTGWVIDGYYIATCYHVSKKLTASFTKVEPSCYIDFGDGHVGNSRCVRIDSVFNFNPSADAAILKLDRTYNFPSKLETKEIEIVPPQDVYVFGFPKAEEFRNPFSYSKFPGSPLTKRLMPGQIFEKISEVKFAHDCSTGGGVSGGPVIDLASGHVVGVHSEHLRAKNMNSVINITEFTRLLDKSRILKKA